MDDITKLIERTFPKTYPQMNIGHDLVKRDDDINGIVDRVQVQLNPKTYDMLIRHPVSQHWCGYHLIDEVEWQRIEHYTRRYITPSVSYAGHAGDVITWMTRTMKGKLSKSEMIHQDGSDYWVGFDTLRLHWATVDKQNYHDAYALLISFSTFIERIRNGSLDLGG